MNITNLSIASLCASREHYKPISRKKLQALGHQTTVLGIVRNESYPQVGIPSVATREFIFSPFFHMIPIKSVLHSAGCRASGGTIGEKINPNSGYTRYSPPLWIYNLCRARKPYGKSQTHKLLSLRVLKVWEEAFPLKNKGIKDYLVTLTIHTR